MKLLGRRHWSNTPRNLISVRTLTAEGKNFLSSKANSPTSTETIGRVPTFVIQSVPRTNRIAKRAASFSSNCISLTSVTERNFQSTQETRHSSQAMRRDCPCCHCTVSNTNLALWFDGSRAQCSILTHIGVVKKFWCWKAHSRMRTVTIRLAPGCEARTCPDIVPFRRMDA